jgi:hypothetical protein
VVAEFHIVRTHEGVVILRKWTGTFVDTYVDAREPPFADPAHDPALADTLLFAGRTRMFENPPGPSAPAANPRDALLRGIRYLTTEQQTDGAWRSFLSQSPHFTKAREQPRIFPTIMVLLAIRDIPAVNRKTVLRGMVFLQRQMRDDLLLAVDGRHHELSNRWDHLPCVMPPDADDTALAWVLLEPMLDRQAVQRVHAVFQRYEGPDGLYPTYFTGFDEEECPPDFANQPSIGVNVDVLAFLHHFGFDTTRLVRGLEDALAVHRYWEGAVYYRSVDVLAFLAAMAVAGGAEAAEPFLDRFLDDHERAAQDRPATPALEKAAYLAAASERCRRQGAACEELRGRVDELRRLQRDDGSWPATPLYQASLGYYGSPAETTAIAVRALAAWLKTPAARDPRHLGSRTGREGVASRSRAIAVPRLAKPARQTNTPGS